MCSHWSTMNILIFGSCSTAVFRHLLLCCPLFFSFCRVQRVQMHMSAVPLTVFKQNLLLLMKGFEAGGLKYNKDSSGGLCKVTWHKNSRLRLGHKHTMIVRCLNCPFRLKLVANVPWQLGKWWPVVENSWMPCSQRSSSANCHWLEQSYNG